MLRIKLTLFIYALIAPSIVNGAASASANQNSNGEQFGTSVVFLVDLSKSFAASRLSNGRIVFGLHGADGRGMRAATKAVAELSTLYWNPPLKVVSIQIVTSSITARPFCAPFEAEQKLIKRDEGVGTREQVDSAMSICVTRVMESSRDERNLSSYTDISGAFAVAAEATSGRYDKRVIIVLSDFHEEQPVSSKETDFALAGEHVIMLHRPGINESEDVLGYMRRINGWKRKLLDHGASSVEAIPICAVTETRIRFALQPAIAEPGTDITILADFKNSVATAMGTAAEYQELLKRVGRLLAELSKDWQPPVTVYWRAIGSSGLYTESLPPIEFLPRLIKRPPALNTTHEFGDAMEELAIALTSLKFRPSTTDISGLLAMTCSIEPPAASNALIIVSDFVDANLLSPVDFRLSPNTRVVMLHIASPEDRVDPNNYIVRRGVWEKRFRNAGAVDVFQFPCRSFTESDLRGCFYTGRQSR